MNTILKSNFIRTRCSVPEFRAFVAVCLVHHFNHECAKVCECNARFCFVPNFHACQHTCGEGICFRPPKSPLLANQAAVADKCPKSAASSRIAHNLHAFGPIASTGRTFGVPPVDADKSTSRRRQTALG